LGKNRGTLERDTTTFKDGPAALKLTVDGTDGHSQQFLPLTAGTTVQVSGFIRSSGSVKAYAFVMSFRDNGTFIKFDQLKYTQNNSDWAAFDNVVTLPDETARVSIGVLAEGKGSA